MTLNAERLAERRTGLENERERAVQSITEHENEAAKLAKELASEKEKLGRLDAEKVQVLAAVSEAAKNYVVLRKIFVPSAMSIHGKDTGLKRCRSLKKSGPFTFRRCKSFLLSIRLLG